VARAQRDFQGGAQFRHALKLRAPAAAIKQAARPMTLTFELNWFVT
jgi:hypothetical protein